MGMPYSLHTYMFFNRTMQLNVKKHILLWLQWIVIIHKDCVCLLGLTSEIL